MRRRWLAGFVVVAVAVATGLSAISVEAAITGVSVEAQAIPATGPETGVAVTTGPAGGGFDIRVQANVSSPSTWRSTRWTSGLNTGCINHTDRGPGTQTITFDYEFESNPVLRESPLRADPDNAGQSEHVFPDPPGGELSVQLFESNDCSGTAADGGPVRLTTSNPGPNPTLTTACQQLQVAVVLDESGSIASAGATQQVRDATRALAQGLVGTGASMAVFKFSTTASPNFIPPYQPVTPDFITNTLNPYLANYNPNGFTNWDAGLTQMRTQTAADRPDLVMFLTDGNPNRVASSSRQFEEGYYTPVNAAANVANQIKTDNSHMFAIGLGRGVTDPLSQRRLRAVSGPDAFPANPIASADYTVVTNFALLEAALREIASNLCNVEVTLIKQTDDASAGQWAPKSGWAFEGTASVSGGNPNAYAWIQPTAVGPPVPAGGETQSATTGPAGRASFVWRPQAAGATSSIDIEETIPPAYEAVSVTCRDADGDVIYNSTDPAGVSSFTLSGLAVRDDIECLVRNRLKRSTVRVVKQWVGAQGSTTIFVDRDGTAPYDASAVAGPSGTDASFTYPASTLVRVGETPIPDGYSATIDCGQGSQPYTGPVTVTSPATHGATTTCTITNTQLEPVNVTVTKETDDATAGTWAPKADWGFSGTVTAPGAAPSFAWLAPNAVGPVPPAAATQSGTTGAGGQVSFAWRPSRDGPSSITVAENPSAAYEPVSVTCVNAGGDEIYSSTTPAQVRSFNLPGLEPGDDLDCLVRNRFKRSTVEVVKQWIGDQGSTTIFVDREGTLPYDDSADAGPSGTSASFTYPASTSVVVGETPIPEGYTATIDCGDGPEPYSEPIRVTSPAVNGQTRTCTITNIQVPAVRVNVKKETDDARPGTWAPKAGWRFDGTVTVPGAAPSFAWLEPGEVGPVPPVSATQSGTTGADGVVSFAWRPATESPSSITITESPSSAYEPVSVTCVHEGSEVFRGAGRAVARSFTLEELTQLAPGEVVDCVVRNRLKRSTVEVVKRWSGPAASTRIFVDRNGSSPFDASAVAGPSGTRTSFTYPVSTSVRVGETPIPNGYTATIDCGQGAVQYTAPVAVTAPATEGATRTCTITNTIVPTPPRPPRPVIDLTKTAGRYVVPSGGTVWFTLRLRSRGPGVARNVRVCDRLPAGLAFVRAPGARFDDGRACWRVRRLAAGGQRRFRVLARVLRTYRPLRLTNYARAGSTTARCLPVRAAQRRRVRTTRCEALARIRVLASRKSRGGGVTG